MNISTPITNAARIITREAGRGPAGSELVVNTAGEILDVMQTGTWYPSAEDVPAGAAGRIACQSQSQRVVQDQLDAIAEYPGDRDAQGLYLHELDVERQNA